MLHRAKHGLIKAKLGWTNSWMHLPLPLFLRLSISPTNSLFIPSSLFGPPIRLKCHSPLTSSSPPLSPLLSISWPWNLDYWNRINNDKIISVPRSISQRRSRFVLCHESSAALCFHLFPRNPPSLSARMWHVYLSSLCSSELTFAKTLSRQPPHGFWRAFICAVMVQVLGVAKKKKKSHFHLSLNKWPKSVKRPFYLYILYLLLLYDIL